MLSDVGSGHMRNVVYRGGLATFAIPALWIESSDDDGATMFYSPGKAAGTLRISVTTFKSPLSIGTGAAVKLLRETSSIDAKSIEQLADGNAIAKAESHAVEQENPITLYWWYIANPVPPNHIRLAAFSFTVLSRDAANPSTLHDLRVLDASLHHVVFAPEVAVAQ